MKLKLLANGQHSFEHWFKRWGLAFLINDDIVFDTFGDARVLMENLRQFKVDIGKIEQVVISHEHWDHVGGLCLLLKQKPGLKVYLPSHADIVLKDKICGWGGEVVEVTRALKLKDSIHLSGEIMGCYAGKPMPEQSIVLETQKGLVVIAGCAHPEINIIVKRVKEVFQKSVYGVIGGFHLKDHSLEGINIEVANLKEEGVNMVMPLHCTGARAQKIFQQAFGLGYVSIREGQETIFV